MSTCFVCDADGPLREGQGGLLVCQDAAECNRRVDLRWMDVDMAHSESAPTAAERER